LDRSEEGKADKVGEVDPEGIGMEIREGGRLKNKDEDGELKGHSW